MSAAGVCAVAGCSPGDRTVGDRAAPGRVAGAWCAVLWPAEVGCARFCPAGVWPAAASGGAACGRPEANSAILAAPESGAGVPDWPPGAVCAGASDCPASVAGCRGESESGAVCGAGSAAGAGAPDWPESGAVSGGGSAAGAGAPDWPESGAVSRQRAQGRRIGGIGRRLQGGSAAGAGAGLAGVGRRLRGRLGSGRRLDCHRRGRGWRQLQRDAAPQRCGRADRGPGAVGGEPPARVDRAGVQLPAVAGGCIANLYGRHRRHRIAQQTGARSALFAEAVGHVEHAAVEALQHHHGARRRRIVAQPGHLLVEQVAFGQEADGGGEMVPVGAAVGGFVDAVEGGAEQHAGGVVGRQRHAGKVGMRVYLLGGHRLPRHAAVAAHEHGRRSGGGQPPRIGRIGGQGGNGGEFRRVRERVHHPVRQAGAARLPSVPLVERNVHAGAAAARVAVLAGYQDLLERWLRGRCRRLLRVRLHGQHGCQPRGEPGTGSATQRSAQPAAARHPAPDAGPVPREPGSAALACKPRGPVSAAPACKPRGLVSAGRAPACPRVQSAGPMRRRRRERAGER